IPEDATLEESYAFVKDFLRVKSESQLSQENVNPEIAQDITSLKVTNYNSRKIGQIQNVNEEAIYGSVTTDRILVILIEYADYPSNNISPFETEMYYPEYTQEHYQDMIFGEDGYVGPNGESFKSMKQFYEEQSGGSYTIEGEVAGWYTAEGQAANYGGNINGNDNDPRSLVYEALTQAAADPTVDLTQYDVEDPYDMNDNGELREPDGIIDHLMVVHSGVGEEAGGGVLGEDAIWSHRWNLAGAGRVVPIPDTTANVDYWGGVMTAMNYTIEPEDGAMGVFAHEYGHDLGLPDEYDVIYSGFGEPVSYWSLMAGGSWAGVISGTEPTGFSPYAKEFLQANMPGSNWQKGLEINLKDITNKGIQVTLDQASTKGVNEDVVKINLPSTKTVNLPAKGEYQYFSGYGNELFNMMYTPVDLRGTDSATLTFDAWYRIENGWDYGYVLVLDYYGNLLGTVEGNITSDDNPNGNNFFGNGLTGFSYGWEEAIFDLSPFVGEQILLAFAYITDLYEAEYGFYVDNIKVTADNKPILTDGAEATKNFYLDGFTIVEEGTVETDHYYLVEWRNHQGSDAGLAHINIGGPTFLEFEPGMLVWYVDNYFANNFTGLNPGNGFLGVVDADQEAITWSDGEVVGITALQVHDATFGAEKSTELFWDLGDYSIFDININHLRVFDDNEDYSNPGLRDAGRNIPKDFGITIRVIGESDDRSVGKIIINKK
ncbi:MAG: Secreted protease metal-dependent protease, partial [Haloplasmataceae bacterium]|nr:Secreted protease metal-dependent protease [Haloplasmataceae bacterium]